MKTPTQAAGQAKQATRPPGKKKRREGRARREKRGENDFWCGKGKERERERERERVPTSCRNTWGSEASPPSPFPLLCERVEKKHPPPSSCQSFSLSPLSLQAGEERRGEEGAAKLRVTEVAKGGG